MTKVKTFNDYYDEARDGTLAGCRDVDTMHKIAIKRMANAHARELSDLREEVERLKKGGYSERVILEPRPPENNLHYHNGVPCNVNPCTWA